MVTVCAKRRVFVGELSQGIEDPRRMKEGEPVDSLEIAQIQFNRISSYLMQYRHLLVPHTSCSTDMIQHSF
jgi:hypothetical protein